MKYKLHKGVAIGTLAAENDSMLSNVFVDSGYLDRLSDPTEGAFLILGRAGSGKTALIRRLKETTRHVAQLDPEELSMQYLQNSALRTVASWGVNLEIFYKYLWRHICILELIRMRYGDADEATGALGGFIAFLDPFIKESRRTRELSRGYLKNYGDAYWVKTDTRVKAIVSEAEKKLRTDSEISAKLNVPPIQVGAAVSDVAATRVFERIEAEVVERAQQIVSDFQIADLNRVVDALGKDGFTDPQNPHFIVIDDLDKNWMPDDALYLDLVKSLLYTVRELNYRLPNAKIIVALREDISHRVFQLRSPHEPQREKWSDVEVKVRWTKNELIELVDNRLAEVYRGQYTQKPPTLGELMPQRKMKPGEDEPIDYLLERTLMRPRDVIDFLNRCFDETSEVSRLSFADIRSAEVGYSAARLQGILDEWGNSYRGLQATFPLLTKLGARFNLSQITEEDIIEVLLDDRCAECAWLKMLMEKFSRPPNGVSLIRDEIVCVWYLVGLVGIRDAASHRTFFSLDRSLNPKTDLLADPTLIVLKMVRSALGIIDKRG
jgi:hypothetical protein